MLENRGPSLTRLLFGLGLLGSAAGAGNALGADSAPPGNFLNPAGGDITRMVDEGGLSQFYENASRSPAGLLYRPPYLPPAMKNLGEHWQYRGNAEIGYLADDGDEPAMLFNDYRDPGDGLLVNFLGLSLRNPQRGDFVDFLAGGIGRDDGYYRLSAGRYGRLEVDAFLNETPNYFSRNAVTLFEGGGTETLSLPPSLVPGGNSLEEIGQALQSAARPRLEVNRTQSGLGMAFRPASSLKLAASLERQERSGARPFGGSFLPPFNTGGNAGGMVETLEPVDYASNEFTGGASYTGDALEFNLEYQGSWFRNRMDRLTFENPFTNLPGSEFRTPRGRMALYPDNESHRLQLDLAHKLPLRGRLFSTLAWTRMRQDEALLPPTVNSGLNFAGIDLDQWNSRASLSASSADAEIDSLLLQGGMQLAPVDFLTLRSELRYREEDNRTDYTAFNPLNGRFGYIAEDGAAGGAVFEPGVPQPPIHYRNIPFADRTLRWNAEGAARIGARSTLGLEYRYRRHRHAWRERDETRENRLRLYLSSRALPRASLRLSYEYAERRGDAYRHNPYTAFHTSSLPGFEAVAPGGPTPHTLAELRKFDLSDRRQNLLSLQANLLAGETMDLLFSAKWRDNRHGARYGLQNDDRLTANLEWNYQPSPSLNAYLFYSYQDGGSSMANINDSGFSSDPRAGGESYPLSSAWRQFADERFDAAGLGLRYRWSSFDIDVNYSYSASRDGIRYRAASASALANPEFGTPRAAFPDLRFKRQALESSLRWHSPARNFSLKLYHRFEKADIDDWHYRGLRPLLGRHLFLDARPAGYAVHLAGLFWQYRMD